MVSNDSDVRALSGGGPDTLSFPDAPDLRAIDAAVAVVLRPGADHGWQVLLCRRAEREDDPWSGNISLPGGHTEAQDVDAAATARRETIEEVGLDPLAAGGRLVGAFGPIVGGSSTTWRRAVGVVVFEVAAAARAGTSDEIVESWWMPVAELASEDALIEALRIARPAFVLVSPAGRPAIVWGLTHHILSLVGSMAGPEVA